MSAASRRAEGSSRAKWWRSAVVYQVYVRSFADSDGDGLGDLPGVRSRLEHLRRLGVDAMWLNPFYPSPQADAGYDVSDYRGVDPAFGTLADVEALVAEAHEAGIRVIIDLVPNHTSDHHPWFEEAIAAEPGSAARARYIFRDGRGEDGALPPNDWQSVFGGPAWTRVAPTGSGHAQWYLHLFAPEQPDLDWTNPEVRAEFESILRFWFDRGVDGFRIDVAHALAKDPELPDLAGRFPRDGTARVGHPHWDREPVHEVYRRWRRLADEYGGDRVFVAEAWVDGPERLARYVRPDELHTAFNFSYLRADWDAKQLRGVIDESLTMLAAVGAPATWVLSNHDVVRHVTRYGGGEIGWRRARAAALLMLALPGGAYIYQGDELGLPEVVDLPDASRQDPTFRRSGGAELGRDGCRAPLPWSGREPSYGFGPGRASWLPQPPGWADLSVEAQIADPGSMLTLYRSALRVRRRRLSAAGEGLVWLHTDPGVLAFTRGQRFACVVNVDGSDTPLPEELRGMDVLLAAEPLPASGLMSDGFAAWLATP